MKVESNSWALKSSRKTVKLFAVVFFSSEKKIKYHKTKFTENDSKMVKLCIKKPQSLYAFISYPIFNTEMGSWETLLVR